MSLRVVTLGMAVLSAGGSPAFAAVHKCAGGHGVPVYQEAACPPGTELRNFDTDPPPLSVVPAAAPTVAPGAWEHSREVVRERAPRRLPPATRTASRTRADATQRRHVHTGMTEGEVLARIGRPDARSSGRKGQVLWTYFPAADDPLTITAIRFERGVVAAVDRRVVR